MKEQPIIFSGAMVRAIFAGTKTQTRRVVSERHLYHGCLTGDCPHDDVRDCNAAFADLSPYGRSGDRLWVREPMHNPVNGQTWSRRFHYDADDAPSPVHNNRDKPRRRPGMLMPKRACRLRLEVTAIRVQRLLSISVDDCFAEGIDLMRCPQCHLAAYGLPGWGHDDLQKSPPEAYWHLWDQINEERGYGRAKDPWVWVVEFKRAEALKAAA